MYRLWQPDRLVVLPLKSASHPPFLRRSGVFCRVSWHFPLSALLFQLVNQSWSRVSSPSESSLLIYPPQGTLTEHPLLSLSSQFFFILQVVHFQPSFVLLQPS